MASYQQRGDAWRVQVRLRGVTKSRTFDTRAEARAWASTEEAKIEAEAKVEGGTGGFILLSFLMQRYRDEISPGKGGGAFEITRINALIRDYPDTFIVAARDFTPQAAARWRDERLKVVKQSTVNRELNIISAAINQAIKEWGIPLRENPIHLITRPPKLPPRTRRVADAEIAALRKALGWNGKDRPVTTGQWVAWVHAVAIETAMRKGEILGLRGRDLHLARRHVSLPKTKNGDPRLVPLSRPALALFDLAGAREPNDRVAGVTSGHLDVLFRQARDKLGLHDLHFHDSKREAVTRMVPKFRNPLELGRVTGNRDMRVLNGYFAPEPEALADILDAPSPRRGRRRAG